MGNLIPEETIEKIHHSIDIVDIIGEYVHLKKQGRNYFGLCPFHGEKTPSFSVSADKQIFHCFGCGAGGNVFSFLMGIEGISFLESAMLLAKKAQMDLPELQSMSDERIQPKDTTIMVEAHDLLKKFYHHLLLNTKEGQAALDYLMNRGFTNEAIEQFEIGYSLDSWDFVTKFLEKRGFQKEMAARAGVIVKKENGDYFDRFRNRIMFPIYDNQGKTVAFSGRVLGSGEPKYLNSPETAIFNKSKILYNFHQARLSIRKNSQVILFEGYADVISAVQSNLKHSIATMGTSLTTEQAKIISRNAEQVIICYDSDHPGIEAAMRASTILKEAGCYVKIATMPDALDPDDYIRKFGAEKFRNDVVGASSTYMSFKIQYLRRGKNLQDEGDRIRYIEEVIKEIAQLDKAVEIDHYLRQISSEFAISLDALKSQQQQIFKQEKKK
jgi:DNA primase